MKTLTINSDFEQTNLNSWPEIRFNILIKDLKSLTWKVQYTCQKNSVNPDSAMLMRLSSATQELTKSHLIWESMSPDTYLLFTPIIRFTCVDQKAGKKGMKLSTTMDRVNRVMAPSV